MSMEPSYDFSDKSWYKRDGQSQTVYMKRTSTSSASAASTSPSTSRHAARSKPKYRDPDAQVKSKNTTKLPPLPPAPPVHPESSRRSKAVPPPPPPPKSKFSSKTTSNSKPKSSVQSHLKLKRDYEGYEELGLPALPAQQTSPPPSVSGSSSFSQDSMEKALIPKRPPPVPAKSNFVAQPKSGAKANVKAGGKPPRMVYVNELGPGGSWYYPVGTAPGSKRKPRNEKGMGSGLVGSWLKVFKRGVRLDA